MGLMGGIPITGRGDVGGGWGRGGTADKGMGCLEALGLPEVVAHRLLRAHGTHQKGPFDPTIPEGSQESRGDPSSHNP